MKKKIIFFAAIFFTCLGIVFGVKPMETQAAPKAATASNGKYIYYAAANAICRMDTNTGKTKTIAKLKNSGVSFGELVYHKGYIYFTSSSGLPETGTESYISRVKAKGGKVKRLAKGSCPVVYNKKIYYVTHNSDWSSKSVCRMSLGGKNKKKLISGASGTFIVANNKIYYLAYGNSTRNVDVRYNDGYDEDDEYDDDGYDDDAYCLYSASLSGKDIRQVNSEAVYELESDGKDVYYTTKSAAHRIAGKTGKDVVLPKMPFGENVSLLEARGGVVYFNHNNKLKKYVVSKKKAVGLKSFKGSVWGMTVGKGKYAVIVRSNPSNSEGDIVGKVKTNGKGYKTLAKYWTV